MQAFRLLGRRWLSAGDREQAERLRRERCRRSESERE
jgi:hypothetical protein